MILRLYAKSASYAHPRATGTGRAESFAKGSGFSVGQKQPYSFEDFGWVFTGVSGIEVLTRQVKEITGPWVKSPSSSQVLPFKISQVVKRAHSRIIIFKQSSHLLAWFSAEAIAKEIRKAPKEATPGLCLH